MNLQVLKRRSEMLDAVCTGLHPSAVMGQLAEKYGVSEKALWSDWLRREKWVPLLLELERFGDFSGMFVERLNGVQKAAWSIYLKASNDSARVGALRTVLEALEMHQEKELHGNLQTQDYRKFTFTPYAIGKQPWNTTKQKTPTMSNSCLVIKV